MQDIKLLKPLNFFSLVLICFLKSSPLTYGQSTADAVETGMRSGTLDNGMRYLIHSKKAWEGQPVSMNLYVQCGAAMEQEGQTHMAHFIEHLPYAVLRDEAEENHEIVRDAIRMKDLYLQAATYKNVTPYYYKFDPESSALYTKGLDLFSRLIGGNLKPVPDVVMSEQGSLYQELVSKGDTKNSRVIAGLSNASPNPVSRESLYNHLKRFSWEKVSKFYKDWYHPERATFLLVGPLKDLDVVEQDIQDYFGTLKASIPKPWENYKSEYLKRPNQFLKLKKEEADEFEIQESEIYLYWRNQITAESELKALPQKWMTELFYDFIEDQLRQIPTSYARHYTVGINKGNEIAALGLEVTCFTERERESVREVAAALNELKEQGITKVVFQKQKQTVLDAINRTDTNALGAVLNTYDQRMLAEESLVFDQLALKKQWLNGLSYDTVNEELKAFLEDGPQDIGILAPKGAAVLNLSEAKFRRWLEEPNWKRTNGDEVQEAILIPDSVMARLPRTTSQDLGIDALGGRVIQLASGARVVLYPQEGNPLKLHGFRDVGALNLKEKEIPKAYLVPEWVHISGVGSHTHFELQHLLTDLGMIYGRALYVDEGECGIRLQAPAEGLEALLQLAHLYLSAPRENTEAFTYWKEDEFLFYKRPPYGREVHDLNVLSKKALFEADAGLTAAARYEAVQQSDLTEIKQIHQALFQHSQEFVFLLSGDFKVAEVLPLLETYLGNLPVSDHQIKQEEKEVNTLPKGPLTEVYTIPGILSSNLNLKIQYTYPIAREDWKSQVDLKLMSQVIATRLKELRNEKKRGLYLMGTLSYVDLKSQRGNLVLVLPTLKGMEDVLICDVEELITWFQEHPVSEQVFHSIKSNLYTSAIIGNSISDKAYRYYKWELETPKPEDVKDYINSLTAQDLQLMLQQKLVRSNRYIFMGQGSVKPLE